MDTEIDDLLDELAIKYLLNLPEEEYSNEIQLCYAFQVAHWEYLDAPETEHLHHKLSFNNFVVTILDRIPELGLNKADVPVLLVQTLVSNEKGGAWMFPRGKMEKRDHGASFDCACREVFEETGFQMRGVAKDDEAHYVERRIQARDETKVVGLYLVPGVDEQYAFCSQTQGEVFQFAWFRIHDLMNQMKRGQSILVDGQAVKFVHVYPFLASLNHFVHRLTRQHRGSHGIGPSAAGGTLGGNTAAHTHGDAPSQWGFDRMLQHNQGLRGQADGMRPYDGVLPQKQQQQSVKQRRRDAAAELEQAQAVQLALEATEAASQVCNRLAADSDVSVLQSNDSGSLNARREGRRRTRRRSRAGGANTGGQAQSTSKDVNPGAVVGKDRRKKGSMDRKEGASLWGERIGMEALLEHWEPIQLVLPEIKWRGMQTFGDGARVRGTQHSAQGVGKRLSAFSLHRQPVLAAFEAAFLPSV